MNHARVKAADLSFHLFERSIHPELFEVVRRADLVEPGYRAALVISGQSHILAVRAGSETLTEVVAPRDAPLPRIGVRAAVAFGRSARDEVRREEGGGAIRYLASFRVETYAPAEYRQASERLLSGCALDRIQAFFDASAGDLIPFAIMDFRRAPCRLEVASVHACPYELAIVHVDTRIEVAG